MENFLDSIIEQANYLKNVVGIENINPEIVDEIAGYVRQADSLLDDACSTHNDFEAGEYDA